VSAARRAAPAARHQTDVHEWGHHPRSARIDADWRVYFGAMVRVLQRWSPPRRVRLGRVVLRRPRLGLDRLPASAPRLTVGVSRLAIGVAHPPARLPRRPVRVPRPSPVVPYLYFGRPVTPPVAPPRRPFLSERPRPRIGPVATLRVARVGAAVPRRARPRVHDLPPPSRVHAARRGTARVGSGSAALVLPGPLARRIGLTAGPYVDADPAMGALVGLRDLALGTVLLHSLDNPLRLRLAVTLDSVVDMADTAVVALPLGPRRVAARGALAGGAVALRSVALWRRARVLATERDCRRPPASRVWPPRR
jgi:hypothetical protein